MINKEAVDLVTTSFRLGIRNFENIAKKYAGNKSHGWAFYHDYLSININYTFTEQELDGLREFYQYAFFYGLIDYLPEIRFFS